MNLCHSQYRRVRSSQIAMNAGYLVTALHSPKPAEPNCCPQLHLLGRQQC